MPTAASFQEKVTLNYQHYQRLREFRDSLGGHIAVDARRWIEERLSRGEQVAFLAYSRHDAGTIEEKLHELFPGWAVANLISSRTYATTVFSEYIKQYWNDVLQVDPRDAAFVISEGITQNLASLTKNHEKAAPAVADMVSKWWVANGLTFAGWLGEYQASLITADQFFERLQKNVLDFEIKHNAIKQSLMNQKNAERKQKNLDAQAKLVVSTIHGAKGLEFDNVLVVHKYDAAMSEPDKRMFYVAFTGR